MNRTFVRIVTWAVACTCLLACRSSQAVAGKKVPERGCTDGLAERMLAGPLRDVEEVVFAVRGPGREWHFYGNFGYKCDSTRRVMYGGGPGKLCRLHLRTGEVTEILSDEQGAVRDPTVHYSGQKVLFSYRKGGSEDYDLYEIDIDGSNLRRLTGDKWDDMEPCYLPDGGIVFTSSRCRRWVPCLDTQVAILYRCDGDGSNIRRLSANVETESTPWVLPDGRVIFMRWEYVHRGVMEFHHLWTVNPDGTGQMTFFGNMYDRGYPGFREDVLMTEPRPIPGSGKIAAIFCDKHGRSEHRGHLTLVDAAKGPDHPAGARKVTESFPFHPDPGYDIPTEAWRDPYPITEDCYLIASHQGLYVMNARGEFDLLYELPTRRSSVWLHEPRPLRPRPREPILPDRTDWSQPTGTLSLSEVHTGRNMPGVEAGDIEELLILEVLPVPVHFGTGKDSLGGVHNLRRVIGTVPVAKDGSAHFEVPALRALVFVAMDGEGKAVKRMNSFVTVMPGETTGCVGCHEQRTLAPPPVSAKMPLAMRSAPASPEPVPGSPDIVDFTEHVQPVLDKHCAGCHRPGKPGGEKMDLRDVRYLTFSRSYRNLRRPWNVNMNGSNAKPYAKGTGSSKLIDLLAAGHHDVKLSEGEWNTIRMWVETGAPYAGTTGAMGYDTLREIPIDRDGVIERKCLSCHAKKDRRGRVQPWPGAALRVGRDLNLTHPLESRLLRRPLARSAGGEATVEPGAKKDKRRGGHVIVFRRADDPDYKALQREVLECVERLEAMGWYGTKRFRPNEYWIREMIRYGVLPADFDAQNDPIDPYEVDRRYFRLFQHHPDEGRPSK